MTHSTRVNIDFPFDNIVAIIIRLFRDSNACKGKTVAFFVFLTNVFNKLSKDRPIFLFTGCVAFSFLRRFFFFFFLINSLHNFRNTTFTLLGDQESN